MFVLALLNVMLRGGVPHLDKKNDSHPGEFFKLIEMGNDGGVSVCFSLWAFCEIGDQRCVR